MRHALDVTGLDLDPAMVERARVNAARAVNGEGPLPSFLVGDVASLSFPDASFDLVVSTFSMHHWADPAAGLADIGRVLRPGGRALVWDLRPGIVPFHAHVPDLTAATRGSSLTVVSATRWPWPWRVALAQRIELLRSSP
jgi:ubiquinone/menaquinone biosynthesis C-methylase UbiE